ncbi:MAG: anthranilate phosphoribosyltransferase [Verrucomicrobia bacterium]|nr:anthranilate phosphoribosyltransferase [Verrucomicrobiota bacterium]MCH8510566.1 anthranilate phosphoribosyltransferase [Kiritimatiellia bacterium]
MKEYIQKLIEGHGLTRDDAYKALGMIMKGEATDAQIAAFLVALRLRGETPDVVSGAARAMREASTTVRCPHPDAVDTCGTGGDGLHTFNISTTAAFVTAGAGVPVAKHGNRGVSSPSGSADVLKELGVDITVSPEVMENCLRDIGIAFLFAPSLHPAMKHAIGPRREIGIRTLFNILGPLSNPAQTQRGVLGVYNVAMVDLVANALADLDTKHMFVVHGEDGLDEITTTAPTHIAEIRGGTVTRFTLSPEEYDIPRSTIEDLRGGDPAENAQITLSILRGEEGPKRNVILLNAAAAICAGGKAPSLEAALQVARESIDSGAALKKCEALIAATQSK